MKRELEDIIKYAELCVESDDNEQEWLIRQLRVARGLGGNAGESELRKLQNLLVMSVEFQQKHKAILNFLQELYELKYEDKEE